MEPFFQKPKSGSIQAVLYSGYLSGLYLGARPGVLGCGFRFERLVNEETWTRFDKVDMWPGCLVHRRLKTIPVLLRSSKMNCFLATWYRPADLPMSCRIVIPEWTSENPLQCLWMDSVWVGDKLIRVRVELPLNFDSWYLAHPGNWPGKLMQVRVELPPNFGSGYPVRPGTDSASTDPWVPGAGLAGNPVQKPKKYLARCFRHASAHAQTASHGRKVSDFWTGLVLVSPAVTERRALERYHNDPQLGDDNHHTDHQTVVLLLRGSDILPPKNDKGLDFP